MEPAPSSRSALSRRIRRCAFWDASIPADRPSAPWLSPHPWAPPVIGDTDTLAGGEVVQQSYGCAGCAVPTRAGCPAAFCLLEDLPERQRDVQSRMSFPRARRGCLPRPPNRDGLSLLAFLWFGRIGKSALPAPWRSSYESGEVRFPPAACIRAKNHSGRQPAGGLPAVEGGTRDAEQAGGLGRPDDRRNGHGRLLQ